jgi:hypothetical protein
MICDVLSDSELDNSSFEEHEEDIVVKSEDDRKIVDQTLKKGSFGRRHQRQNFPSLYHKTLILFC